MPETPDERPRPTPRPRPSASARPAPRARVAGTRPSPRPRRAADPAGREQAAPSSPPRPGTVAAGTRRSEQAGARAAAAAPAPPPGRRPRAALVLGVLCGVAAVALGVLLWQRPEPQYVRPEVFDAARGGVEALYAYDYRDSERSVQGKLDVLTGDLREQYAADLQGGIIDTYEQVSATTRYEVLDIGLQQVDDDQTAATLVVFGQYVVESVNSGTQAPPEGSECTVTPEGAQSCTQTVQVDIVQVDGEWKISELTLLTTS
ncbi:hypothetical protein [Geodermatophilus ruber]|uniref:Mce-associated membrane protein n=1 Tax=Geodermatophilus ruber TaxID=504800 RepID=A0A1I3YMW3_9ACTN|nr:hypothetical protein [Geodermatophilus ruber]SFK32566.1 hypothetical protein SAMN04488085_10197 [Geodermatophilus ruber]